MKGWIARFVVALSIASCMLPAAQARPWTRQNYLTGRVTLVISGNFFLCESANGRENLVRMADIEAPEPTQPYGEEARRYLRDLIWQNKISIKVRDQKDEKYEKYENNNYVLGELYYRKLNVNREMIRQGYAWANRKNTSSIYLRIERDAHSFGFGLWHDVEARYPAEFRRENPMDFEDLKKLAQERDEQIENEAASQKSRNSSKAQTSR